MGNDDQPWDFGLCNLFYDNVIWSVLGLTDLPITDRFVRFSESPLDSLGPQCLLKTVIAPTLQSHAAMLESKAAGFHKHSGHLVVYLAWSIGNLVSRLFSKL